MKRSGNNKELDELRALLSHESEGLNPHLDSDLGALRYLKDADQISRNLPAGKVLDWGCGLGQMTFLLKNRGFDVVSYDVDQGGKEFLSRIGQTLILAADPVILPFADSSFDAVLSSGVLEHVPDPIASLREVARITKKSGYFFVFRLPNKYSYIEFISDRLGRGDHPVKYSRSEILALLNSAGFEIVSFSLKNFMPHNLKGYPMIMRRIYHLSDVIWAGLDRLLTVTPLINNLCTNIEIVARRK